MTEFLPAPPSLFNGESHIPFGIYDGLIKNTSTASWDKQGGWFKARRTSRKAWIFFGVYSPEFIGGLAIADAGFFTNAFAYYYSLSDGIFCQDSTLIPLGFASDFDPNMDSEWRIGNYQISTANGKMQFQYNGKFTMHISAALNEFGFSTVVKSEPGRPFNFAYKNVHLAIEAIVENNGKTLETIGNYGAIDYTKGYPPRKSIWNWCSFIGKTESGKSIGLNLVKHFNDEMENILWINNRKISLGPSVFSLIKPIDKNPWQIGSADERLHFKIFPFGARKENTNLLVLKSNFTQIFGRIEGVVNVEQQEEKFSAYGVAEDHLALW